MYKCEKCNREFKNKGGFVKHGDCTLDEEKIKLILFDYLENKMSYRELNKKYFISLNIIKKIIGNLSRTSSEGYKNFLEKNPNYYNHSDETKKKLSDLRKKWLFENQDKSVWRERKISYPEKIFKEKIEELGLDKKYLIIREKCVYPFYIDFAFENEKVAVEIDGSQHEWVDIKERDLRKEDTLKKNGWRIYRVTAKQILDNRDLVIQKLLEFIGDNKSYDVCGIITFVGKHKLKKQEIKKEKEINNGLSNKQLDLSVRKRKIKRPDYLILKDEIIKNGYTNTGKKYNVSDNTVRKWMKWYERYGNI